MPYRLYRTPIPEDSLQNQSGSTAAALSELTQLNGGGTVTQLGTQVGDLSLDLQYRGQYAARLQEELRELVESATLDVMPLAPREGASAQDGYYTARDVSASPAAPQSTAVMGVETALVREGTQGSHLQAVDTRPSSVTHPFGNDTQPLVGIPAAATEVEAIDSPTTPSQRTTPTPVDTVSAEHGSVDRYDPSSLDIPDPIYCYDLDYDQIGDVDPGVWDTWGAASITDANDIVQWQRVFDPAHDYQGAVVLENGLVRVRIDAPDTPSAAGTLTADSWSAGWTAVSLPDVAWQPVVVDVTRIGAARVDAHVVFEATGSTTDASAGDRYSVSVRLARGFDTLLVMVPSGDQGAVPADLQSLLDPIASPRATTSQHTQALIACEEVRY